jgi:abortive infection bacteriophage resistance protein
MLIMRFAKPPKTYEEQLDLLISRGMQVGDRQRALHYLSHLNYYRLAAYLLPFEQDHATHQCRPGTHFDQILEHYIFDRELRLLILDAIERVEVSLRTKWAYHLAHSYGAHAHLDSNFFKAGWQHRENIESLKETVRRSSEVFVRHFRRYDEELPPVWVICEIMTFGQLSNWYSNLRHGADRNAVAHTFDMDEVNLTSFIHHLSIVRNHCAHHSTLWNREFTVAWRLPNYRPSALLMDFNRSDGRLIYNTLVMLAYMMDTINPGHHWKQRLGKLFEDHPNVSARAMGFPDDWRERAIWKGSLA